MNDSPNVLAVGWAARDVSTDRPVAIRGQFHLRLSQGVRDPLTVTALALSRGDESVLFLSCDCIGIRPFLVRKLREKVRSLDPSVPAESILMNATHTHAGGDLYPGPDPYETPERMPGAEYQAFFIDQAADAVLEAWRGRRPGGVAWGFGYASVAHSRRTVYLDDLSLRPAARRAPGTMVNGHAAMYGTTNDPMFSHFEAGADAFLNVLFTFDPAGALTGAVVNVPCPSQVDENLWMLSADYWHETRLELRKRFGDRLFVLPQCGAAGDLSPHYLYYKAALKRRLALKGVSERQDIAERIAAGAAEVYGWARKDIRRDAVLRHVRRTVPLPLRTITREEYEQEVRHLAELEKQPPSTDPDPLTRLKADSTLAARRRRCQSLVDRYQAGPGTFPMELHVVRLGGIAFASNGFELYMDYAHRIQARSPAEQTFIIQLAGNEASPGGGGYLPTARGLWGRGYSADVYSNQVNAAGGQELVEETLKDLNALFAPGPLARTEP